MTGFYTLDGKGAKVKYTFTKKEYDEYLAVIELMGIWGGVPCDVGWARGTNSYQEGLKLHNATSNKERETKQLAKENS